MATFASLQAHDIGIEFLEEILIILPLSWNMPIAIASSLIGESHTSERTVKQVALEEIPCLTRST